MTHTCQTHITKTSWNGWALKYIQDQPTHQILGLLKEIMKKVDNSDATIAILLRLGAQAHLLGGRVANVDKGQVGQVHAEEG